MFAASNLSGKTQNNYLIALRAIYRDAMLNKLITTDISQYIKSPSSQTPEPQPLSKEEVDLVLGYMREHYHPQIHNYFATAIHSGCRTSELIALRWADVDMQNRLLIVSRAKVEKEIKSTKTNRIRHIHLTDAAAEVLQNQRRYTQLKGSVIFENCVTGKEWNDDQVQRKMYWIPTLKALGLPHRAAYSTRATFASLLLSAGANVAFISSQLGHGSPAMLLRHYGRWIKSNDRAQIEIMERIHAKAN